MAPRSYVLLSNQTAREAGSFALFLCFETSDGQGVVNRQAAGWVSRFGKMDVREM